jgi:hypothetical protein
MPTDQPPSLTVRGAADLLALVPYLLGFHPADSLVTIAIRDHRVLCVGYGDLPAPDTPADQVHATATQLAAMLAQHEASTVVVVGYGPAALVDPVIPAVRQAFAAHQVAVHDALRVDAARYYSYLCTDPDCCPADGTPVDPARSAVTRYATRAGLVALPDRAALRARVAPVDDHHATAMQRATEHALRRLLRMAADPTDQAPPDQLVRRAGRDAVHQALHQHEHDGRLTDDEAAWLCLLLAYPAVRDYALARTDLRDAHLQLWTDLTRRAQPDLVPAPASLAAFAAWRRGEGPLAREALNRALSADPADRLAQLLSSALQVGLPPSTFDERLTPPTEPGPDEPSGAD